MQQDQSLVEARQAALDGIASGTLDVLVVGGGVNGAGILRDLALRDRDSRGLRLALVERAHFSSGTSGRNSQLIHGGLRYLKNFEFKLVSEALAERAILLRTAPHLVEPLAFLIPMRDLFSALFYGAGLFLYDLLAGKNRIERPRHLSGAEMHRAEPGMRSFFSGARFFDCRVHSARLVLLNVREAVRNGALAVNYLSVESREKGADGIWNVELLDRLSGLRVRARARCLVDATGAWSRETKLRLVRGSHLIYPRIGQSENAISYFGRDGRIIFFIPWGSGRRFTLVGTTDVDHQSGPDQVRISPEEVRYLMKVVEEVFPHAASGEPICAYSSLRPLVRDESSSATKTSREHRIWADENGVVHVSGGKYTTYRLMSEEASDLVTRAHWPELAQIHRTSTEPLAGNTPEAIVALLAGVPEDDIERRDLIKSYGVDYADLLADIGDATMGLTRLEAARIRFAARVEFVQRLTDLMFVSTYWGYERRWTADLLAPYARELGRCLAWTAPREREEIDHMLAVIDQPEETGAWRA